MTDNSVNQFCGSVPF